MTRVVAFLKSTRDQRITYAAGDNGDWPALAVFADADFAGCLETRRSTTGVVALYNGSPVAWSSKRQTISIAEATAVSSLPALSSGEAELNAITYATREAIGMRVLLQYLGELPADTADDWNGPIAIWTAAQLYRFAGQDATDQARQPTLICSDSRAAIGTATRPPNRNARHHHLRAHFVRDAIAFRIVQVKHVRTQLQLADALTKAADLDMLALFHQVMQGQTPMPATVALYK